MGPTDARQMVAHARHGLAHTLWCLGHLSKWQLGMQMTQSLEMQAQPASPDAAEMRTQMRAQMHSGDVALG